MTSERTDVDRLLERLGAVEARLAGHAGRPAPSGLTDPDPGGSERWESGQVWAHVAEFPGYWLGQVRMIVDAHRQGTQGAVPFGRPVTDLGRIAAIEAERWTEPGKLLRRVTGQLSELRQVASTFDAADWAAAGRHPTRGEMHVDEIVERFVVSHLEEHADQLDGLAERAG
jgi:hypothetical protein